MPGPTRVAPLVSIVLRNPGQPLDTVTRASMEQRFGHDFGHVRVHTDADAARSAGLIHAQAYTLGRHVVMGQGRYQPHNRVGRRLLAHELTHVIQQGNAAADTASPRGLSHPSDPAEREADAAADAVTGVLPGHRHLEDLGPLGAPSDLLHRQDEEGWFSGGGGRSGGGGASGSWHEEGAEFGGGGASGGWDAAGRAEGVSLVQLVCESPTSGVIDFHLRDGNVVRYRLTVCELTPGDYSAEVEVSGQRLVLHVDTPGGLLFRFRYAIGPGQPDPSTFFAAQRHVAVRAGIAAPPPGPTATSGGPLVCSRPLDFPAWTRLRNFRHAFINDPPANYAIRGLVSGNGVTTSCSTATDASGPPDDPATSTCTPCRPAPGTTVSDVSACLRRTHAAYPSPNLYRNLPDPSDGWRHGPNSNSYAAAMARCCHGFSPAGLGILPGWNHSPAGPCPRPVTGGGASLSDESAPLAGTQEEGPRDAGPPIPAGVPEAGLHGQEAAPTDLHAFGNRTKPRDPRLNIDIDPNPDGTVGPEPKDPPWPDGASTFGEPDKSGLSGHYHRIDSGTRMAAGLRVIADGAEVGGPQPETHHTIFPADRMPFQEFVDRFQSLGWAYAGKK